MQIPRRFVAILVCLLAGSVSAHGADPAVPISLAVAANQEPALVLTAKGVQIYECRPVAGDANKLEWAFKAPEAELFDAAGEKVGKHYAGPTWELTAGGKVVGKVKAKADAPDGKGIPWLLLDVVEREGGGTMAKVQSIQRVATVGGKAPAEAANESQVGQERRVVVRRTCSTRRNHEPASRQRRSFKVFRNLPSGVTPTMPSFLSHPRTRLNALGIAVLVAGMGIAGFLYRSIPQDDAQTDADILLAQEQFKGYDQAVQRNIGATGLLAVHATETLENLAKPRPLAILSMTVSGVVAGGFFLAASRHRD